MAKIKIDIVTAERTVLSDEIDILVAPGTEGQLGVLPSHAPLMTMLTQGELMVRKGSEESYYAVTGGFLEVRPDKIIVLADAAERADEIDVARAEEARKRAQERLTNPSTGIDVGRAEAALGRSLVRLKVSERKRRKPGA
jgi:F-type H+-transporting ATPase subunit epsilon